MKKILHILTLLAVGFVLTTFATASETIVVPGAGPSTKIVEKFCKELSAQPAADGYTFEVPPKSIKHAGGIRASGLYLFGRTGRPLNEEEKAMNKDEIILARVPIAFVVGSDVGVSKLTIDQLEDIYSKKTTNWKQLGGIDKKIVLVGREPTEALYSVLKADYPFFVDVEFDKVVGKDHRVVSFLESPAGECALGFGAKPNLENLHIITVDDFASGVSLGLVYDLKNKEEKLVEAAKKYANSNVWAKSLREDGLLLPKGK
jgi:hypothetical protein